MNKIYAFFVLLLLLFGVGACSSDKPELQWQEMVTILQNGEKQLAALPEPRKNAAEVQEILHGISTKLGKVKVKDEDLQAFKTSSLRLLDLTAELIEKANTGDKAGVAAIQQKIQAELPNNYKLNSALEERFAATPKETPKPAAN